VLLTRVAPGAVCCPFFVPIASKPLVILVIVVRAKGVGFPNDSAKCLTRRAGRKCSDPDCKTSTPGSNPGGASKSKWFFDNLRARDDPRFWAYLLERFDMSEAAVTPSVTRSSPSDEALSLRLRLGPFLPEL
jgi:hypothetical protein